MSHGRRSSSGLAMSVAGGLPPITGAYTDADPFAVNPVTPTHPTVPLAAAEDGAFNPYADYNPPPSAFHMGVYRDRTGSGAVAAAAATAAGIVANGDRERRINTYEMGSLGNTRNNGAAAAAQEPLLANYQGREPSPPNGSGGSNNSQLQRHSSSGPPPYTLHPNATGGSQPPLLVPISANVDRTSTTSSVYSMASGPLPDGSDTKGPIALTTDEPEPNVFRDYFFGTPSTNPDTDAQSASAASSSTRALGAANRGSVAAVETPNSIPFFTPMATPGGAAVTTPRDGILDPTLRERWDNGDTMDLRDDEDYSRRMLAGPATVASSSTSGQAKAAGGGKVLGVRNPDTVDPSPSDLGRESWTPRAF